jgi:hypothetical protein
MKKIKDLREDSVNLENPPAVSTKILGKRRQRRRAPVQLVNNEHPVRQGEIHRRLRFRLRSCFTNCNECLEMLQILTARAGWCTICEQGTWRDYCGDCAAKEGLSPKMEKITTRQIFALIALAAATAVVATIATYSFHIRKRMESLLRGASSEIRSHCRD